MDDVKKLFAEQKEAEARLNSRRHFLKDCTLGLGGIALGSLLNSCSFDRKKAYDYTAARAINPMAPIAPPLFPKVKSVIYLHMVGAPSQLELFDYKPELAKLHNKPCPPLLDRGKGICFHRRGTQYVRSPSYLFSSR